MLADPVKVQIPKSYETLPVKHVKVSHYPEGAAEPTPVIVVTLNRPQQGNAFTNQMMTDFELIYPMLDLDERVKVIVITGAGKFFCAGADLDIGFPGDGDRERIVDHRDRQALCSFSFPSPSDLVAVAVDSTSPSIAAENPPSSLSMDPRLAWE